MRYLFCVLFCVVIFFSNCSRQPPNTVTDFQMSSDQVREFLVSNKITPLNYINTDMSYALPDYKWIEKDFSFAFNNFKQSLGMGVWMEEEHDCDDFARLAATYAQFLHHNTTKKLKKVGFAFGEFYYLTDEGFYHAINFFLYREGQVKISFYEPQLGKPITLSKDEIQSGYFLRL